MEFIAEAVYALLGPALLLVAPRAAEGRVEAVVVQGLLLGRVVEVIFDAPSNGLYPVVGLAAVLGAGYRTPLAAVMFVAETTGQPGFIVPALFASVAADLVMGEVSITTFQRSPVVAGST